MLLIKINSHDALINEEILFVEAVGPVYCVERIYHTQDEFASILNTYSCEHAVIVGHQPNASRDGERKILYYICCRDTAGKESKVIIHGGSFSFIDQNGVVLEKVKVAY